MTTDEVRSEPFFKDPADVLDYSRDWTPWMVYRNDTIATSIWTPETGITVDSDTKDALTTTVWVSGGTAGETYQIVNRVVTVGGRTLEKSITVRVEDK